MRFVLKAQDAYLVLNLCPTTQGGQYCVDGKLKGEWISKKFRTKDEAIKWMREVGGADPKPMFPRREVGMKALDAAITMMGQGDPAPRKRPAGYGTQWVREGQGDTFRTIAEAIEQWARENGKRAELSGGTLMVQSDESRYGAKGFDTFPACGCPSPLKLTGQPIVPYDLERMKEAGRGHRCGKGALDAAIRMMGQGSGKLDRFTQQYIATALWSTTDWSDEDSGGDPLEDNYDLSDIDPKTLDCMIEDCRTFQEQYYDDISSDPERAGHDFWLTRNRHGAGFWDGDWPDDVGKKLTDASHTYGEFDLYVGDDGVIYGAGCEP
jgi:hypothetical protein